MKKNILVFGASNSKNSINRKLASFAANQLQDADINLLDLNDFEMPIYSIDREKENGIHPLALQFKEEIKKADGILISFAEHNGSYTTAFKNIYDWISRIESNVWLDKPMLLLSTSPGGRGGQFVLDTAYTRFKFTNSNTVLRFSLPFFLQNFSEEAGILDEALKLDFEQQLADFQKAVWG